MANPKTALSRCAAESGFRTPSHTNNVLNRVWPWDVKLLSVAAAKDFITAAIKYRLAIGKGYGPANPMDCLQRKAP